MSETPMADEYPPCDYCEHRDKPPVAEPCIDCERESAGKWSKYVPIFKVPAWGDVLHYLSTHRLWGLARVVNDGMARIRELERDLAAALDQLHGIKEYRDKNPLGGPAKVFDAMADCVRAGDDFAAVLKEYGFCTAEELAAERERADRNQEDAERWKAIRSMNYGEFEMFSNDINDMGIDAAIDAARRK